jgi:hypothetical protein
MTKHDPKTGRFISDHEGLPPKAIDPFTSGTTVNEATFDLSNYTLEALNFALAQAQSDIDNVLGGTK